ncbi:glycosyltransferase family 4 protein [Fusobacterium periodonticum]|uniref:glycosyltransferase family 4 protein n=1 Tax=Fusobacterium periodonticum TaxID=860 RepID=UPI00195B9929|nr:glycosyltransferase family 4 protein [Fusobacterium periodonticum]VTX62233.1 Glycosyl transferases group 1 [Fusobacterium periodonticum]
MKIVHVCLASHYTEGMNYQDNILPDVNSQDGHEVLIISNAQKYINGKLVDTEEEEKYLKQNLKLIRIKYDKIFTKFISEKIRKVKRLYSILESFKPDIILFHGMCAYELLTVSRYKKENSHIKLYVDSHEDFINSARTFFSKNILHRLFYKKIALKCLKYIDKVLYISEETRIFLHDFYEIPNENLEFYPLGGFIIEEEEKKGIREKVRKELKISEEDLILIHSGKLDKLKKTSELLEEFSRIDNKKIHLIIIGSIPNENTVIYNLIKKDKRIKYLGWKTGDELLEYICASDVYMQPGSQSSTSLTAICCGLPILLYPSVSYKKMFDTNVFWAKDKSEIKEALEKIVENPNILENMSKRSYEIAKDILDYKKLSARLYI